MIAHMKRAKLASAGLVLVAGLCGNAVQAQDAGWTYEITPYLWGAGLNGRVGAGRLPPADVELSFSDILQDLSLAGMVSGSATKGRYGFFGDLQYIVTTSDVESSGGFLSGQSTTKSFIGTLGGEYISIKTAQAEVRMMAGIRQWVVSSELDVETPIGSRSADGENAWVDGVAGVRGRYSISQAGTLTGAALIGTGGSESMVDVFVGYEHALNETSSLVLGYRYLNVDRDDGDFLYDIEQDGILLGARFVFD